MHACEWWNMIIWRYRLCSRIFGYDRSDRKCIHLLPWWVCFPWVADAPAATQWTTTTPRSPLPGRQFSPLLRRRQRDHPFLGILSEISKIVIKRHFQCNLIAKTKQKWLRNQMMLQHLHLNLDRLFKKSPLSYPSRLPVAAMPLPGERRLRPWWSRPARSRRPNE